MTGMLILAAVSARQEVRPPDRFTSFYARHKDIRCHFTVLQKGKAVGSGWIEMHRDSNDPKAAAESAEIAIGCQVPGLTYTYRHSPVGSLEVYPKDKIYDRISLPGIILPLARRFGGVITYPSDLVQGFLGRHWTAHMAVSGALEDESGDVQKTIQSSQGQFEIVIKRSHDGAIILEAFRPVGTQEWTGFRYSDYQYSPDPAQKFSLNPPVGYRQYAFDIARPALAKGEKIPAIRVISKGHAVSLTRLLGKSKTFLTVVDSSLPAGLISVLKRLSPSVTPVIISRRPLNSSLHWRQAVCSSSGLDLLGIGGFPQMYLVQNGKTMRAWRGFWPGEESDLLHQIAAGGK